MSLGDDDDAVEGAGETGESGVSFIFMFPDSLCIHNHKWEVCTERLSSAVSSLPVVKNLGSL
jgi:hypothetical protein